MNFWLSQGSAATDWRYGGKYYMGFVRNLLILPAVKEFWHSYRHEFNVLLFGGTEYSVCIWWYHYLTHQKLQRKNSYWNANNQTFVWYKWHKMNFFKCYSSIVPPVTVLRCICFCSCCTLNCTVLLWYVLCQHMIGDVMQCQLWWVNLNSSVPDVCATGSPPSHICISGILSSKYNRAVVVRVDWPAIRVWCCDILHNVYCTVVAGVYRCVLQYQLYRLLFITISV